ncbi:hypothetical protein [Providencia alcalifaciens]|uniref:hypothetical protein n=1 Tax=Providencia alcalifaciens TaxID=126385 RepID=UPI00044BE628|nr:hypothetical protein [Providencia alcalifaciens]EUD06339.1 hypothetical protein HMPREF1564_2073 [Providencia alcalifaciens R90-1475]
MKERPKCKRNNCQNHVSDIPEARKVYLCLEHYSILLENKQKRVIKAMQKCVRSQCEKTLIGTQNQKYCSNKCRYLNSRLINDDVILKIIKHSYWRNVERFIKRNPKGLASISDINDIADMVHLYVRKAGYQKSYVNYDKNRQSPLLIPFMDLEVCHFYPNSEGGMNTLTNTLIGPAKVNRLRSNRLPKKGDIKVLNGEKSVQDAIKLETTLLHGLADTFSEREITTLFQRIGRLSEFHFYKEKKNSLPTSFSHTLLEMPLTKLLLDECHRMGLHQVTSKMNIIKALFFLEYDFIEILSICLFYSILSGDEGDLFNAFMALSDYQVVNESERMTILNISLHSIKHDWTTRILNYVTTYFNADITTEDKRLTFYSSFFAFPKHGDKS